MPLSKSFNILTDIAKTTQKLAGIGENLPEVYKNTISDMKARLPGKVASAVTWMYNIKKKEIKYSFKKDFTGSSVGAISIRGEDINTMTLVYTGSRLTPIHFSMTPKEPKKLSNDELLERKKQRNKGKKTPRKRYHISVNIKGRVKNLPFRAPKAIDSALFLAPVTKGSSKYIPFWRITKEKNPLQSVKTLSLPQMIDNKLVRKKIEKEKDELLEKRLNHHMARFVKKTF